MRIYIVMGRTGHPFESQEWPVIAYPTREFADQHVQLATEKAQQIGEATRNIPWKEGRALIKTNTYDPEMIQEYHQTEYYVMEVNFSEGPPVQF
jgi:hypothetical protein